MEVLSGNLQNFLSELLWVKKKEEIKENQEGSTVMLASACFAGAVALLEGPSGKEDLHLRVSSRFVVSFRLVCVGLGCLAPLFGPRVSFVRSLVLAGGACTLPCQFLVCVLGWLLAAVPMMIKLCWALPSGV